MAISFDIECVISKRGFSPNDTRKLLELLQKEPSINSIKHASYAMATFGIESACRAYTYESHFLNSGSFNSPSNASPSYVKWGSSKKYSGPRYPNGVPVYVGRGLIQITHDYNYKTYSALVPGLYNNPDLAMNINNAWIIAMKFLRDKNTFSHVDSGNLTLARRSVNGGTNHIDKVNESYQRWLSAFTACGTRENQRGQGVLASNVVPTGSSALSDSDLKKNNSNNGSDNLASNSSSQPRQNLTSLIISDLADLPEEKKELATGISQKNDKVKASEGSIPIDRQII
jgi:hypothetical protein